MSNDKNTGVLDDPEIIIPPDYQPQEIDVATYPGLRLDSPVRALGHNGQLNHFLDASGQFISMPAERQKRTTIVQMFGGNIDYLIENWPRLNKQGETVGFAPEEVSDALIQECFKKGIWSPANKIRQSGGWLAENRSLVFHAGDRIFYNGKWHAPGEHGKYIYPTVENLPRPDFLKYKRHGARDAWFELLNILREWFWVRPGLDERFCASWMVLGLGGAGLPWRPHIWCTGGAGTGKSMLMGEYENSLVSSFYDGFDVFAASVTEPAVRHALQQSSRPVRLDETESKADNAGMMRLLDLVTMSSSGSKIMKGSQAQGEAVEFQIRSAFSFSSIIPPPFNSAISSRVTMLQLQKIPKDKPPLDFSAKRLSEIRSILHARLLLAWPLYWARLDFYRELMRSVGHTQRGADQYGTLLAMACLMESDDLPDKEDADKWADLCRAAKMTEKQAEQGDETKCVYHLLSAKPIRTPDGMTPSISSLVRTVMWPPRINITPEVPNGNMDIQASTKAAKMLESNGVKVLCARKVKGVDSYMPFKPEYDLPDHAFLAISCASLAADIFKGTNWASQPGTGGVWAISLARAAGAVRRRNLRFEGMPSDAVLVPLKGFVANDDAGDDSEDAS